MTVVSLRFHTPPTSTTSAPLFHHQFFLWHVFFFLPASLCWSFSVCLLDNHILDCLFKSPAVFSFSDLPSSEVPSLASGLALIFTGYAFREGDRGGGINATRSVLSLASKDSGKMHHLSVQCTSIILGLETRIVQQKFKKYFCSVVRNCNRNISPYGLRIFRVYT